MRSAWALPCGREWECFLFRFRFWVFWQRQVWQLLGEIPYGETTTYGALARRIAAQQGRPVMSAQAVGGAVGRNPIAILIPCHRVLSAHGPGGYGGGLWRKQLLLAREGVSMPLSE